MELYSLISRAEEEDEEGVLMLLDIEKAFDSVSWEFLTEIMECLAFPPSFVQWIKVMYNCKEVKVLNNGHISEAIFSTWGVAQGCRLSPLLFILTIETLALSICNNDRIEGYHIGNFHKKLSLLADDMILCLKARSLGFQEVLQTLSDFAIVSDLSINYSKSSVYSIGKHQSAPDHLDISPFSWSQDRSFQYLGIQVLVHRVPDAVVDQPAVLTILDHVNMVLKTRNSIQHCMHGRILNVKTLLRRNLCIIFLLLLLPH